MKKEQVLVIIPTYNENGNIGILIRKLLSLGVQLSILVVDDNSADGTAEKVRALQRVHENVHLLVRDKKRGLGSAYRLGFTYALENGYDIIVQMDADLSHDPSYLPGMLSMLQTYQMVIGSRYIPGGRILQWSFFRRSLSRIASIFVKHLLGIPCVDSTSGFKCMRAAVIKSAGLQETTSQGYFFQIEMLYKSWDSGSTLKEFPIQFRGRVDEQSKMSCMIILEAFLQTVKLAMFSRVFSRSHRD